MLTSNEHQGRDTKGGHYLSIIGTDGGAAAIASFSSAAFEVQGLRRHS
ncbi:hypothetical protein [Rhizobium sullae]|nr:hypothetical protein [Rhizobium sullae]